MHPTAASCDPLRMPPPWLHPVQASTKENNDSQATLCPRPPWMSSPGSGNPGTNPQIDRIPVEVCPHGNGSQAVGILQPFNVMTPEISEKPSAASSESGDSVLEQPQETEGPWWMSMVHNFTPSWVCLLPGQKTSIHALSSGRHTPKNL